MFINIECKKCYQFQGGFNLGWLYLINMVFWLKSNKIYKLLQLYSYTRTHSLSIVYQLYLKKLGHSPQSKCQTFNKTITI